MIKCLATLVLGSACALALDIGGAAPPLAIATWYNGDAFKIEPGKVYIVEFWATWCRPCLQTIPLLSKLQKKLAAKGVLVVGISNETADKVEGFLKEHAEMDYRVGLDKENGTWGTWMEGIPGIPHAFVVDRKGVVVWKGHPMSGMDQVVERVIAGSYGEKERKANQLEDQMQGQLRDGDLAKAEATCFEIIGLDPSKEQVVDLLFRIYAHQKKPAKDLYPKLAQAFAGKAEGLARLAMLVVNQESVEDRDLALAVSYVKDAKKLGATKDVTVLRAQARIEYLVGLIPRAVGTAQDAADAAEDEDAKKDAAADAAYYRSALEAQKKLLAE